MLIMILINDDGDDEKRDVQKTPKCTHLKSWRSTLGHARCGLV